MKIHEYQARQILADAGIPVPPAEVVRTPDEAAAAFKKFNHGLCVVKAQVYAGGRGKAGFVKLVKTADEAEKLKQRIANGEAFDVLAKKFSTCPSGKRGGDLGEIRPGQMVGAIDQVIFKKPLRVVHGPIKSKFGYHLVQTFYRD